MFHADQKVGLDLKNQECPSYKKRRWSVYILETPFVARHHLPTTEL